MRRGAKKQKGQDGERVDLDQRRAAREIAEGVDRNRRNAGVQRQIAHARRQALDAQAGTANLRAPVDPDQQQLVAGEDQMRVVDLRIDVPDLGSKPWIAQKVAGDVPQRVAFLHHVFQGRGVGSLDHRWR